MKNLDILTVNGVLHKTFQHAAIAMGLCADIKECQHCFREALVFSTASELRYLFIMLSVQGFPTLHIFEDAENRRRLMEDLIIEFGNVDIGKL